MEPLTQTQLFDAGDAFNAAVSETPGIDPFCSAAWWAFPAFTSLLPGRTLRAWQLPNGFATFAEDVTADGELCLVPLEATWLFGCGLVGKSDVAQEFLNAWKAHAPDVRFAMLSGLEEKGRAFTNYVKSLAPHCQLFRGPQTARLQASLTGGLDGYMARRAKSFQRAVFKDERRAERAGVDFEILTPDADDMPAAFERLLAVEAASRKADNGLLAPPMRDFYRGMVQTLAAAGAVRLIFARLGGRDVGYILGAVAAGGYRGLQFSFDDHHAALSVGNVLQLRQITRLCEEGVELYDMGMDAPYKHRWATYGMTTTTIIAHRL